MNKDTSILVLSHKSKNLVINLIDKLYNKFPIIVVDNSDDLELKKNLSTEYPKVIFHTIQNNGYGAAINFGSNYIKTKYFIILNPDIEDLDEKKIIFFEEAAARLDDKFSVLGPRYTNLDVKSIKQSNKDIEIANWKFISGSCMFVKKKIFNLLNGFDENFFLYFEETDVLLNCKKNNLKVFYLRDLSIEHERSGSIDTNLSEIDYLRSWHYMWSMFYFYKKNYNYFEALKKVSKLIIKDILMLLFYLLLLDKKNYSIRLYRLFGVISSMIGLKSFLRP